MLAPDGSVNENGAPFTGMMRYDARIAVEEALKEKVRSQLHGTCCTLIHPISQSFAFVHFVLTGWEIEGTPGAFW